LFRLILPLEVPAMNSEFDAVASRPGNPSQTDACATQPAHVHDQATIGSVTFTYEIPEDPGLFSFAHDRTKGVFIITKRDGSTELFRDNPVRYLVVEPDPQTGELRPTAKCGLPVYLYLCREQREP
jgi:hypothetical protein